MRKRMLHLLAPSMLLLATVLAGCNKEEADGDRLPEGKYPLTFTATLEGQATATRVTTGGAWTGSEEVAIQIGGEVKKYTAAADGKLTVASSVTPWYWQNTTETKACKAWYPYSATKPETFTVATDQSNVGYQSSDMLYASQDITYNKSTTPSLNFKHLPAKVVVNLVNGDGVTADQVKNATVSLVGQSLTSGAIAANWTVTKLTTSGSSAIAPNVLAAPTNGYLKTVQAIVVPQQSTASVQFIKVSVAGQEFFYSTVLDFGAGTQHTYNITVLKTGLSVTASGAEAWTGTTTDVTSKEPIVGYAADDLKIGDYYYSNGTYSDGGYRRYSDGSGGYTEATLPIMPVLTDAGGNARTVIGIVYSTDPSRIGEAAKAALAKKSVTTPHGLVMALTNASDGCRWGDEKRDESIDKSGGDNNPFQNHTDQLNEMYNNVNGYAETQWMVDKIENGGYDADTYKAFDVASKYGTADNQLKYAAPSHSTGWFLPSMGQWWDIVENLGGIDLSSYRSSIDGYLFISGVAQTAVDNLNKYLQRVEDATTFSIDTYFWSSSEYDGSGACYVNFNSNGNLELYYNLKSTDYHRVRCSLAF